MAVYDYTPLYGAGDIIPGLTASIFQNLGIENPNVPVFELLGSANKGGKNANERMVFAAQPGQSYRLVNNATGDVLGEASTPEGISALVEQSNALSKRLGKKADIAFEQSNPEVFGGGYTQMFQDQPDEVVGGFLGNVMDVGIPLLSSLVVPGAGFLGTILPAAAGSAASSAMQGRGLEETLLRAAISGAGAGVGEGVFGQVVPAGNAVGQTASLAGDALANLPSLLDDIAATAAQNVASAGLGAAAQAVAPSIVGDILATAIKQAAPSAVGSAVGSAAASVLPSLITPQTQVQQPAQPEYTAPPENLIVTAQQPDVSTLFPAATGAISNTLLDQVINQPAQAAQTQQPSQQEYTPPPEEIVLTAPQNILPPTFTAPEALAASAAANALGSTVAQSPEVTQGMTQQEIEDVTMTGAGGGGLLAKLTANMGLTDYLTAASLLGSGVRSLFGGGGSAGTTAGPYVSPFGAGVGFGAGQDMRVNPNIADYERYAFGPEATFFAPGYSQLVSGAAGAPMQTTMGPQSAMINPNTPTYTPLI